MAVWYSMTMFMDIRFKNIIPLPLKDIVSESSPVWNQDFVFETGKKYLVSALSGVGKTTLLSIIYGLRRDFEGELYLGSQLSNSLKANEWSVLRQTQLSMVFQGLQLFKSLSVWDNILLKNRLSNYTDEQQIMQWMQVLEVDQLKDKYPDEISFGQKQRVAIVRALCQPFQWLLLDEPFSHLDDQTAHKALHLISERISQSSSGVILSSLSEQTPDDYQLIRLS